MFAVPSIMKLFDVGRAPMMLIALPTPCRIPPCSPVVSTAPAPRNSSCRKFRPLSGRSVTCFSVMVCPTEALPVSSTCALACTSTVSVTLPASSAMSTRWTWSTVSATSELTASLNPAFSPVTT